MSGLLDVKSTIWEPGLARRGLIPEGRGFAECVGGSRTLPVKSWGGPLLLPSGGTCFEQSRGGKGRGGGILRAGPWACTALLGWFGKSRRLSRVRGAP